MANQVLGLRAKWAPKKGYMTQGIARCTLVLVMLIRKGLKKKWKNKNRKKKFK